MLVLCIHALFGPHGAGAASGWIMDGRVGYGWTEGPQQPQSTVNRRLTAGRLQ